MEKSVFGRLPLELKLHILSYLSNFLDRYNFALLCGNNGFAEYFQYKFCRTIDLSFDYRMDNRILEETISLIENPESVTHLNLNGLYWIDEGNIKTTVEKLCNLESLFLVDTKVNLENCNSFSLFFCFAFLKKLHTLTFTRMHPHREKHLLVMVCENDGGRINFCNLPEFIQRNQSIFVSTNPELSEEIQLPLTASGKSWINEICNSRSYKELVQKEFPYYKDTRLVAPYQALSEIGVNQECRKKLSNIQELILTRGPCSDHFMQIAYFINLQRLSIFTRESKNDFLKNIFEGCKHLKSLKIQSCDIYDPYLHDSYHLKHAKTLEELSIFTPGSSLDIDQLLKDIMDNANLKLQKIYINGFKIPYCNYSLCTYEKFLRKNPQLIFFNIYLHEFWYLKELREILRNFTQKPFQHFQISTFNTEYYPIPISHLDMLAINSY